MSETTEKTLNGRTLYIHPMTRSGARLLAATFRSFKLDALVLPQSDMRTLELGNAYSSGEECLPEKITLGDYLKVTEMEGFDLISIDPPRIKKDDDSIDQIIERAVEQYRRIVEDNNGIRTRDLKRLLMPVGIALSDLDQTWLNSMNSLGGQRGFVAHKSRLGIRNLPDPKTENDAVNDLLVGLQELDEMVVEIRKKP